MRKFYLPALLWLFGALPSTAQEKTGDTIYKELDQVIFSVNKWEQLLSEVPNKIIKIDLQEARIQNPQTTADLLGQTGAVFIQKSQLGGGSPMIRGFATNRILIVVDGVRMNNAIYRSGNLQNVIALDALNLENAEVIFGPGSLIYGSDAIGGVMDFHTLTPRLSTNGKLNAGGAATIRYASANNEQTGHAHINLGGKKLAWLGSVTYSDFGDLKMGSHGPDSYLKPLYVVSNNNTDEVLTNPDPEVQKFSGYHQWNVLQKLRYKPVAHLDLQYGFHYSTTGNVPRYDRLIEIAGGNPRSAQWYYGPQLWQMHSLQVLHTKKNGLYDSGKLVAALQHYEESRHDRRLNNNWLRNQAEEVKIFSANLDLSKSIGSKSELYYGLEIVTNKIGSFSNRINRVSGETEQIATRYPDNSDWHSYAGYISLKSNVHQKVTLTGGLRYNYVTLTAPFDTTFFKFPFTKADNTTGALTGSAGLVYRPASATQINLNFSTGFRVPNIDDIGKIFESVAGQLTIPNPDLKPEYAYNTDLGIVQKFSNHFSVAVTGFYTLLDDAIVRRPSTFNGQDSIQFDGALSQVTSLQNAAKAEVWGIQGEISLHFAKHFTWRTQANWIEGKETDEEEDRKVPLRHAPPFYGKTSITFTKPKWTVSAYADYNGAISNSELAPSEQGKTFIYAMDENGLPYSPSWYTLNIKGNYRINQYLMVSIGWENITDQRYRPYSSGIAAAGSNFVASVTATL